MLGSPGSAKAQNRSKMLCNLQNIYCAETNSLLSKYILNVKGTNPRTPRSDKCSLLLFIGISSRDTVRLSVKAGQFWLINRFRDKRQTKNEPLMETCTHSPTLFRIFWLFKGFATIQVTFLNPTMNQMMHRLNETITTNLSDRPRRQTSVLTMLLTRNSRERPQRTASARKRQIDNTVNS